MKIQDRDFTEQPHPTDIREALQRVVASEHLSKSPQLANFLRFVVEESLAGKADRIKAYTIAADALGRGADFDPQIDPIVRVEAGRLRRALNHYYANGGSKDPIVIEMPRGRYAPVFRANSMPRRAAARMNVLRRQWVEQARVNFKLVLLISAIAAAVSLCFDLILITMLKPA